MAERRKFDEGTIMVLGGVGSEGDVTVIPGALSPPSSSSPLPSYKSFGKDPNVCSAITGPPGGFGSPLFRTYSHSSSTTPVRYSLLRFSARISSLSCALFCSTRRKAAWSSMGRSTLAGTTVVPCVKLVTSVLGGPPLAADGPPPMGDEADELAPDVGRKLDAKDEDPAGRFWCCC